MENLIKNLSTEWPTAMMTFAFVIAGACTYAIIRLFAKLILDMIGPIDDDMYFEEEEGRHE